ncbi:unnamed protein product [Strongylus vulgaris]|uniref:Uncharacterized protein n=1 Tax=Strongylus vulgaris TaxID=40348 RepID=A0A3P7J474_STRVU|nr:unnamed protein product [Strongylus vulgaris]
MKKGAQEGEDLCNIKLSILVEKHFSFSLTKKISHAYLGFRLLSVSPENSYTRKNIGYLYAIKNGAKWIYDTDDDNKPYGGNITILFLL